jgi:hypothetical protein
VSVNGLAETKVYVGIGVKVNDDRRGTLYSLHGLPVASITAFQLQISSLFRFVPPLIIQTIRIINRSFNQFLDTRIQTRHTNKHKIPAHLGRCSLVINVNAAGLAERIIDVIGSFVVVCHSVRGSEKTKVGRLDADCPKAAFGAESAIATPGAVGNICVNLELNRFAMAASVVRFCHYFGLAWDGEEERCCC